MRKAIEFFIIPENLCHFTKMKSGCWIWNRCLDEKGYGRACYKGRVRKTHRVMYEVLKGPLVPGLVIDHLCRNRACVNPDHLEQVTQAVNYQRGMNGRLNRWNIPGSTCKRGHVLTPANTKMVGKGRTCRQCWREAKRASYQRRKAA